VNIERGSRLSPGFSAADGSGPVVRSKTAARERENAVAICAAEASRVRRDTTGPRRFNLHHPTALVSAITTSFGACATVLHPVLVTFGGTGIAGISASSRDRGAEATTTREQCRHETAEIRAVAVQTNARGDLVDVFLVETSVRAVYTLLSALVARFDAAGDAFLVHVGPPVGMSAMHCMYRHGSWSTR
jgi:hypothetical protein